MNFFWKVFSGTILVILATAFVVDLLVTSVVRDRLANEIKQNARGTTPLIAAIVQKDLSKDGLDSSTLEQMDQLLPGSRVTIIGADGQVLFDTHENPAEMDNHGGRTEVKSPGTTVERYSRTLEKHMTYYALPVVQDGKTVAWARVALPQEDIQERLAEVKNAIRVGVLIAVISGLLVAFFIARRVTRPITEVADLLQALGRGETHRRLPIRGRDEIGNLARSVNSMADELQERLDVIARDRQEKDAILSGMTEGVIAVDQEQHVVLINAAAREMVDVVGQDIKGRPIWEVTRIPEITGTVSTCLSSGKKTANEVQLLVQETERSLQLVAAPFFDNAGQTSGCVLVLHDLSELRRLEKVRRDFVANVSHELKTPLTSMRGFVETVHSDPDMDPNTRTQFLAKALAATERLSAILQDLFSLARIESEEGSLVSQPLDLVDLAKDCVRNAQSTTEIKVNLSAPAEVMLCGHKDSLEMALSNLLDNAIKYSPTGGEVNFRISAAQESATLEVEDSGPGIPLAEQERIFERFYRVDKNRSRKLGGTGLGLSIVRNVVAAHSGQVSVNSQVGKGSTFSVVLPR